MPPMGESVSEGTILEWRKREGDEVAAEETLVEVSTDKVDAEVPAPAAGTISKILVSEGDTVEVGQKLAEITTNGASAADIPTTRDAVEVQSEGADPPAGSRAEEEAAKTEADQDGGGGQAGSTGTVIDIVTPEAGESVSEGTILEWHVEAGEKVQPDQTVVEISTDKVDAEVPAPVGGTVVELLVDVGQTVTVGQVLARLSADAGGAASADGEAVSEPSAVQAPEGPQPSDDEGRASPVARRIAAAEGVDLETGEELLLRLRERQLRRELETADPERTKELQAMLTKLRAATGAFA